MDTHSASNKICQDMVWKRVMWAPNWVLITNSGRVISEMYGIKRKSCIGCGVSTIKVFQCPSPTDEGVADLPSDLRGQWVREIFAHLVYSVVCVKTLQRNLVMLAKSYKITRPHQRDRWVKETVPLCNRD